MSPTNDFTDLTGRLLGGRYRVTRLLGSGGMGAVYEAVQEDLRRSVAIKLMHPSVAMDQSLVDRFRVEAQAAAAIGHPNITQVFDFHGGSASSASLGEPPFIVMELLSGTSLRDLIARSPPLSPARVAFIGAQVLSALGAAHARGIVHRDVKPANVFICSGSAITDLAKVLDFGVAKLAGNEGPESVQGAVVGTMDYMAPEQARGETVDARADLYSVGVMLYHALTGKKPFSGSDMGSRLRAILFETPAPLGSLRPDVPSALIRVIERAMEKDVTRRFASAEQMQTALTSLLPGAPPQSTMMSPLTEAPSTVSAPDTVREAPQTTISARDTSLSGPPTAPTGGTAAPWMLQTMMSPGNAPSTSAPAPPAPVPFAPSHAPLAHAAHPWTQPPVPRAASPFPVPLVVALVLGGVLVLLVLPLSFVVWRTATMRPPTPSSTGIPALFPGSGDFRVAPGSIAAGGHVDGDSVEDFVTIGLKLGSSNFHLLAFSGKDFRPLWVGPPLESEAGGTLVFVGDVVVLRDYRGDTLYTFDAKTGAARGKLDVNSTMMDLYESPTSAGVLCLPMAKRQMLRLTAAKLDAPVPATAAVCPSRLLPWDDFVKLRTESQLHTDGVHAVAIVESARHSDTVSLAGFDVPSLRRVWTQPLPDNVSDHVDPVVAFGRAYVTVDEGSKHPILVFDVATGAPRFQLDGGVELRTTTATRIYTANGLVPAANGDAVTIFDASTGARIGSVATTLPSSKLPN